MIRDRVAQEARLATARRLMEEVLIPAEAETDATDEVPAGVLAALREAGLFGISIPEAHGGLGLTMEEEAELMLVLGRAAPAYRSRYALNSGGAAQILLHVGTPAQQGRWLPAMARGEVVAAFCLSEAEAGSDAGSLQCAATLEADGGWVLDGTKRWVTNAPEAGLLVVMARSGDAEISAFAVPADAPGVSVLPAQRKMGLRGAHVADVRLHQVRLPADALLGPRGGGLRAALRGWTRCGCTSPRCAPARRSGWWRKACATPSAAASSASGCTSTRRWPRCSLTARRMPWRPAAWRWNWPASGTVATWRRARRRRPSCSPPRRSAGSPTGSCRCMAGRATWKARPPSGCTATPGCSASWMAPRRCNASSSRAGRYCAARAADGSTSSLRHLMNAARSARSIGPREPSAPLQERATSSSRPRSELGRGRVKTS